MVARNIIKNLAAAEDILHGVGTVQQTRNGQPLTLNKVDIPLGLATAADLAGVNPAINPRVRIGNTELEYINGNWQERLTLAPYQLVVGLTLDNRYNMVIKDGVVAKYTGTLPYITTGTEDITVAPWQVLISTGSGGTSGNGIIYSNVLPPVVEEGVTYFNAEKMEQVYSYNDGDSVQYLAVPLLVGSGGATAGSGSGGTSTIAPALGTDTSLVANTSTDADHKIKVLKQGSNVTLTSDGTSVTINANAGGISYNAPASTLVVGTTFFNPNTFEMSFAYNDGNSSQYVTFPLAKPLGGGGSGVGTTDHSLLSNRGIADQHPIAAIAGLQVALDSKQAVDADLTAIAGLSNGVPKRTAEGTWTALVDIKEIVVSTTPPTDTTKLWLDIN